MNVTAWKWLAAISLAFNIGVIAMVLMNRTQAARQAGSVAVHEASLPDYLQLSAAQRRKWHDIEEGFLGDVAANWKEIRNHREILVRQVLSDAPVRSAIDAEQARIAALQDQQQRRVIEQLLAERELLDQSQRSKLVELLLSQYRHEQTEEEALHRR